MSTAGPLGGMDLLGALAAGSSPAPGSVPGATPGPVGGPAGVAAGPGDPHPCSRRGCRADAVWALEWNNPRVHAPERTKTWLACREHRAHLEDFLEARGFLRRVRPLVAPDHPDHPDHPDDEVPA
ncbi:hypothetical protein AAG742_06025 [Micrococcus sp. 2A]|uniref:hypothetical protein n=1 Tax=Micrococcus sp. 2A TaxID=3142261 RepID=UPI0031B9F770